MTINDIRDCLSDSFFSPLFCLFSHRLILILEVVNPVVEVVNLVVVIASFLFQGPFVHVASIVATLLSKFFTSFRGIYEVSTDFHFARFFLNKE